MQEVGDVPALVRLQVEQSPLDSSLVNYSERSCEADPCVESYIREVVFVAEFLTDGWYINQQTMFNSSPTSKSRASTAGS